MLEWTVCRRCFITQFGEVLCLSEPRAVHVWRYGEDVLFCKLPSPPCPALLAVPSKSNSSTFFYRNELSLSKISKQQADNNVGSFFVHFRATRALQQLTIVLVLKAVATCLAAFFFRSLQFSYTGRCGVGYWSKLRVSPATVHRCQALHGCTALSRL